MQNKVIFKWLRLALNNQKKKIVRKIAYKISNDSKKRISEKTIL